MAISSISSYSTTRITGLTSGMDTDSLVTNMLKAEQSRIDSLYKANTKLEWKRDYYNDINTQLSAFRTKFMSALSSDTNIFSKNTYKAFKVSMASNNYVGITATSGASVSNHNISSITKATAATLAGAKYRNRTFQSTGSTFMNSQLQTTGTRAFTNDDITNKTLDQLVDESSNPLFDFSGGKTLSFSVNGEQFTYDGSETLAQVMADVNGNAAADATMSVDASGKIVIKGNTFTLNSKLDLRNLSTDNELFGTTGVLGTDTPKLKALSLSGTTLEQLQDLTGRSLGFGTDGKVSFKINGVTFEANKTDSIQSVMDQINASTEANVIVSYNSTYDAFTIRSATNGTQLGLTFENVNAGKIFGENGLFGIEQGTTKDYAEVSKTDTISVAARKMGVALQLDSNNKFTFKVNDVEFSFDAGSTTLQKMIDTVNANEKANVTMGYSQITDSFTFASKGTGASSTIKVSNVASNAFGGTSSFFGIAAGSATGTNAVIVIDGERVEKTSNSFELDGLKFDLKADFVASADNEKIVFNVEQDVDGVVEKVKNFVKEYNELISMLNGLVNEQYDYKKMIEPLTEAERSELSEKELEKWDAEAKKGVMRNDTAISALLSSMRTALYEKVGDTGLSAADLGLKTGAWYNYGKIEFEEDTFRAALEKNASAVADVMAGSSSATAGTSQYHKESGIVTRLYDQMTLYESNVKSIYLKNTEKKISDNEEKIDDLLVKMYNAQEKYYLQFAQMEKLLTSYQSQSQWLTSQLSALGGS